MPAGGTRPCPHRPRPRLASPDFPAHGAIAALKAEKKATRNLVACGREGVRGRPADTHR